MSIVYTPDRVRLMFDVDGTLALSQQPLSAEMAEMLRYLRRKKNYHIHLATSQNYRALQSRIPFDVLMSCTVWGCDGHEITVGGETRYIFDPVAWPEWIFDAAQDLLALYHGPKTGDHFVDRRTMGALTLLGRNPTSQQRKAFIAYDQEHHVLDEAAARLTAIGKQHWPAFEAQPHGKTTVDFSPYGVDKTGILTRIRASGYDGGIVYFGDSAFAGNDCGIMAALRDERKPANWAVPVRDPTATLHQLQRFAA